MRSLTITLHPLIFRRLMISGAGNRKQLVRHWTGQNYHIQYFRKQKIIYNEQHMAKLPDSFPDSRFCSTEKTNLIITYFKTLYAVTRPPSCHPLTSSGKSQRNRMFVLGRSIHQNSVKNVDLNPSSKRRPQQNQQLKSFWYRYTLSCGGSPDKI